MAEKLSSVLQHAVLLFKSEFRMCILSFFLGICLGIIIIIIFALLIDNT